MHAGQCAGTKCAHTGLSLSNLCNDLCAIKSRPLWCESPNES